MTMTMEQLKTKITFTEELISTFKSDLATAEEDRITLYKEYFALAYGVDVGVVVRHEGKEYKVVEIRAQFCRLGLKPYLVVHSRKKDGTWGHRKQVLYNSAEWEVVKEPPHVEWEVKETPHA